jgi:hypothetical protein
MSFFPIIDVDAPVEPASFAELRSDTPLDVREGILTEVDNYLRKKFYDPLDHRTTINALNILLQHEPFQRYPPCHGINTFHIPDRGWHAVFALNLKDALGWHAVVYDPNDYAGTHLVYTLTPFAGEDIIRPLMRRQEGLNFGPLVGPGVCYALSYAFCRLYRAFFPDRHFFESIITNDRYDARDFLRIVLGTPNNWIPILKGERDPPSLEQLRHYFRATPKRKRE